MVVLVSRASSEVRAECTKGWGEEAGGFPTASGRIYVYQLGA